MTRQNRKFGAPLFLVALMLLAPFATAATVTTFANGDASVDVELRDGQVFSNTVDGAIGLPAGETVTGATMKISTDMVEHSSHMRVDTDSMPRVWNPDYNNQLTLFSNLTHFQIEDGSTSTPVSLKSDGFLTDFEGTTANFESTSLPPTPIWEHGSLFGGSVIPTDCASGTDCWGTNVYDDNYTDDNGASAFESTLRSSEIFVEPFLKSHKAYFNSFHSLEFATSTGSNPQSKYFDCAYLEIRSSNNPGLPPDNSGFTYLPIDIGNSTGISYSNGYYLRSSSSQTNKIDWRCGGVATDDYALGGTSVSAQNPSGWAEVAIDLSDYIGMYVQIQFVMEHNAINPGGNERVTNNTLQGWYVDNFRLGSKLPQSGSMTVRNMLPSVSGGDNHPNGYGILNIEAETTSSATITVDVLDSMGQTVFDKYGAPMTGLQGKIIELWDISSTDYPTVNLRFNFDSGVDRLSTPVFHGFSLGTRVGTGFNQTDMVMGIVQFGVWESQGMDEPMMYSPNIVDTDFNIPLERQKFDRPITAITPVIQDDCSEDPAISSAFVGESGVVTLQNGVKKVLDNPIFGFNAILSYSNPCNVGGMWFDLEFGHHSDNVRVDVANDGDIDWAVDQPAFGYFGRQTTFWDNELDGVNYGSSSKTITTDITGTAQGAHFLLPKGATITAADVAFDMVGIHSTTNQAEGFDLYLMSSTQEEFLTAIDNTTVVVSEGLPNGLGLVDALNNLMANALVPTAVIDDYGNEWYKFYFKAVSPNASSGASMTALSLDVVYDFSVTLNNGDGLDQELNQGVALWDGGATAQVPVAVTSTTGGGITLSDLSVSTSAGYDNTISLTGNFEGLYPDGTIYEIVTTHEVADLTGSSLAEATLSLESSTGNVVLSYSEFLGFSEASDEDNLITLESSSATPITDGQEVTWRFRVNSNWEDTAEVRIYAGLVANNGVNGLPDAVLLAPVGGNAVENDAQITSFELQNSIGTAQDLDAGMSNQEIRLTGSVRLEGLTASPDPAAYYMTLELLHVNNTDGNITMEWEEIANQSGSIGGDFNWLVDLGANAAGDETYRFQIAGYEGGDTLCPAASLRPDADCAIPFNLSIDTYDPNLVAVKVLEPGAPAEIEENWRQLYDDTWVVPSQEQNMRIYAQDLPTPPAQLTLNVWVEHDHDSNGDGIADADEYMQISMDTDGGAPNATYLGVYSDTANEGKDPVGKVSVWVEGWDLAGNPIDGGAPGFENDLVTYASMSSKAPVINNFYIEDSSGERLVDPTQPTYTGTWDQTMYAGNVYHLIVEASDDNGWRDVDYIQIDLDDTRDDMTLLYYPRNETAWTDSPYIEIVAESNDSEGTQLLRMDGGALIDTFEEDFYLDMPIRIAWGLLGEDGILNNPQLWMQDFDNPRYRMLEIGGRHVQKWFYASGIQLDYRTDNVEDLMIAPFYQDAIEPLTRDVRKGFVYGGDTVTFSGQYAYVTGMSKSVFVNPEVELTMEITRLDAVMDGAKGYVAFPGEVTYHSFTGGQFNINLTAPPVTNVFQYEFRLINLPTGAVDSTDSICVGEDIYGCGEFYIKVDMNAPRVSANTWTAKKGETGEILAGTLSTATYHCVDVEVTIEERETLLPGDVKVAWMFYNDPATNAPWVEYLDTHGSEPMTAELDILPIGGAYTATASCIDLWPIAEGQFDLTKNDVDSGVEVVMWIEGVDSAGSIIQAGGGLTEAGNVAPIMSGDASHKSMYSFIHEEAKFAIDNFRLSPSSPQIGDAATIEVEVRNSGTMAGAATLVVKSVTDGGLPVVETTFSTNELGIGQRAWSSVTLEAFTDATTGMYYIISDNATDEVLYDGSTQGGEFNVKIQEVEDEPPYVILAIVAIIAVVIIVVAFAYFKTRESGASGSMFDDDDEYEDDVPQKAYAELPTTAPAANVSPEMARAMEAFPQWTQDEIQGYFDQGWSIESLQEWVNSQ